MLNINRLPSLHHKMQVKKENIKFLEIGQLFVMHLQSYKTILTVKHLCKGSLRLETLCIGALKPFLDSNWIFRRCNVHKIYQEFVSLVDDVDYNNCV